MPPLDDLDAIMGLDPSALAAFAMSIDENQIEQDREVYEGSLIKFFQRAWREIDPSRLKINWHHELIADHLEAVAFGEIRRLVINIPPRCTKSLLANVCFPAWLWAQPDPDGLCGPQLQLMCISYGSVLSMELARTARRLILSPWYQRLWGHRVRIFADQGGIENFGTTAGGFRIASSMTGANLGRGGLLKILDDAHKIDEIESETERSHVIRIYDEQLTTRETDPSHSAEIILMQRTNELDLTGHVLGQNDPSVVHVCLPMRYDPERHCSTPWGEDPRTRDGELLWPDHFPEAVVRAREARMGPFATAAQYNQSPVPRGGGIIERDWWQAWPDYQIDMEKDLRLSPDGRTLNPRLPDVSYVLVVLDTAISLSEQADWNACTVWGIWHGPEPQEQPRAILMGAWRRRCRLHDDTLGPDGWPLGLVERTLQTARVYKADAILIEDKTRGRDVRDELIREMTFSSEFMLHLFDPKKHGDKTNRLLSTQPLFTGKLVYAPIAFDPKTGAVVEYLWVTAVLQEVSSFPRAQFDDFCLVYETLIETDRGPKPIGSFRGGEWVLTPSGFRRVTAAACTGFEPVIERCGLVGTAGHRVFDLDRGWVSLDTVTQATRLSRIALCDLIRMILPSRWSLWASNNAEWEESGCITYRSHAPPRGAREPRDSMLRCGNMVRDNPFLRSTMSIIATAIRLISITRIWSVYRWGFIGGILSASIERSRRSNSRWLDRWHRRGISLRLAESGIGGLPLRLWSRHALRRANLANPNPVSGAARPQSGKTAAEDFADLNAGGSTRGGRAVCASAPTPIMRAVYNLTVEGAHCYYANGVLVHNCDTVSMALLWLRGQNLLPLPHEHQQEQIASRLLQVRRNERPAQRYGVG